MSIIWSDSDPIIEPSEQLDAEDEPPIPCRFHARHLADCEEPDCEGCITEPLLICAYCGEVAAELTTVNDSDPSAGYSDSQELCAACIRRLRAKRAL